MRVARCSVWLSILVFSGSATLRAQDALVVVRHETTKEKPSYFEYRPAGDPMDRRMQGVPRRIRLTEGQRLCVQVGQANPLLYAYSLSSTPIVVTLPDSVTLVAKALASVVGITMAGGAPDLLEEYPRAVARMFSSFSRMSDLRLQSDKATDFKSNAELALSTYRDSVLHFSALAEKHYSAIREAERTPAIQMTRAHHRETELRAKQLAQAYEEALGRLRRELCETPKPGLARITLAVAPNGQTADKVARYTNEQAATFEVATSAETEYRVTVGALANVLFRRYPEFTVGADSVIRHGERAAAVTFAPMVFAGIRSDWTRGLDLRLGAGFGKESAKTVEHVFVGLSHIFGSPGSPNVEASLGAGFSFRTLGLKEGVVAGTSRAEPSKILNDYLDRSWAPGLAFGLSFKGF